MLKCLVSVSLLLYATTGVSAFTVTTTNANVKVKENEGVDLICSHSPDFGPSARVEWKFNDLTGSQKYLIYDGKPTGPYTGRVTTFANGNVRFDKVTRADNGEYDCEVSGNNQFSKVKVKLTVLVPPSIPTCRVPKSVTTGSYALLSCHDRNGSPPPKYKWYKNNTPLPDNPKAFPQFKNMTYKLNPDNGNLEFPKTAKMDTGDYYCEAFNEAGPAQRCKAVRMEVRDLNTGGIVAGVIVGLLALALLGFGLWFAHKKGYLPKKSESKPRVGGGVYQPTSIYGGSEPDEDGEFRQKSSFVV